MCSVKNTWAAPFCRAQGRPHSRLPAGGAGTMPGPSPRGLPRPHPAPGPAASTRRPGLCRGCPPRGCGPGPLRSLESGVFTLSSRRVEPRKRLDALTLRLDFPLSPLHWGVVRGARMLCLTVTCPTVTIRCHRIHAICCARCTFRLVFGGKKAEQ